MYICSYVYLSLARTHVVVDKVIVKVFTYTSIIMYIHVHMYVCTIDACYDTLRQAQQHVYIMHTSGIV